MADETGDVLRRSLDAVDRHRRIMMIGLGLLAVMLVLAFVFGLHSIGRSQVDAVLAHFFMLIIWVTGLTVFVVIQIASATKRILRAIELATKK